MKNQENEPKSMTIKLDVTFEDSALLRRALATWLRFRDPTRGIKKYAFIEKDNVGPIIQNQVELFCKGALRFHHENQHKDPVKPGLREKRIGRPPGSFKTKSKRRQIAAAQEDTDHEK